MSVPPPQGVFQQVNPVGMRKLRLQRLQTGLHTRIGADHRQGAISLRGRRLEVRPRAQT